MFPHDAADSVRSGWCMFAWSVCYYNPDGFVWEVFIESYFETVELLGTGHPNKA